MPRTAGFARRSPTGYEMELGAYSAPGAQRDDDAAPFDRAWLSRKGCPLVVHPRSNPLQETRSAVWQTPRPSAETIEAVQKSCMSVVDKPVRLAEAFYGHLFSMAPSLRPMFADDLSEQMQKMTDTLLTVIAQLAKTDTSRLEKALHQMGVDHYTRYQVEPTHYLYVAHALTRAVRDITGREYSSRLSSAWISVCKWVTEQMCAGAYAAMLTQAQIDAETCTVPPTAVPDPRTPGDSTSATPSRHRSDARRFLSSSPLDEHP
jgi:hemoglobin-like flavoprotein